ncbi:copper chaperone PCu(A)C [Nocardiopsis dassonvillei]|uniref:copper chaperone PCu(A)C n=1 Tax=Nocardiopsis dassonvillei TaxID=2014 RepID=UPI00102AD809|nr:copper chaperone PCu(A)C [Nocardiopsis dassonvillei]MCP3013999.1 copper chaperone PCu(A)C [Nocardiopsis dassonvillei]
MDRIRTSRTALAASLLCLGLALTACGGAQEQDAAPAEEAADSAATAADAFSVTDPWIKAVTAEEGMTGVFGVLANGSDEEITVVSADYDAAGMVELHEVVSEGTDAAMREKEGGFPIPAGGSATLEPGGDHIMLMELTEDLQPGAEATVTVEFSDGSTTEFTAAVKDYAGANEEYEGGHGEGHGDGEHGSEGEDGGAHGDEGHGDH